MHGSRVLFLLFVFRFFSSQSEKNEKQIKWEVPLRTITFGPPRKSSHWRHITRLKAMDQQRSLFIFVTAAGSAHRAGELIRGALDSGWTTYVVGTPNLELIAPAETLLDLAGARWIRDYGQPPLDIFPFGTMLVAPCTFNTFNKLACGLADNLATAMVADALGAGRPIFIAPSINPGLWSHPQARESHRQLRAWGCTIIDPQVSATQVTMAATGTIVSVLQEHFHHGTQ
jgi:hypothetical protein